MLCGNATDPNSLITSNDVDSLEGKKRIINLDELKHVNRKRFSLNACVCAHLLYFFNGFANFYTDEVIHHRMNHLNNFFRNEWKYRFLQDWRTWKIHSSYIVLSLIHMNRDPLRIYFSSNSVSRAKDRVDETSNQCSTNKNLNKSSYKMCLALALARYIYSSGGNKHSWCGRENIFILSCNYTPFSV